MQALYQRLKELDRESFEKLCGLLLKERHPGADIRPVDGSSGDGGVDIFLGDLRVGPTIWQVKGFPNGVRKSQKQQIRDSLKNAVRNFRPRRWVLCLNIDMDVRTHGWFQRLATSYTSKTEIGLMQATDVVSELIHRKSLRHQFFPQVDLDIDELRALLARTADKNVEQLLELGQQNMAQLIDHLTARDARFDYQVSVSTERTPQRADTAPKATFSIITKSSRIDAFPRDIDALRLDPPKATVTFKGTGIQKFLDFQRTGLSQTFQAEELGGFSSNLPVYEYFAEGEVGSLTIEPSPSPDKVIPLRLTFGTEPNQVTYEYLPFRLRRAGREEAELFSDSEPFEIILLLQKDGKAKLNLRERVLGCSIPAIDRFLRALLALEKSPYFEAHDLQSGTKLFSAVLDSPFPPEFLAGHEFFEQAARVCQFFNADLRLNREPNEQDLQDLALLTGIMSGTVASPGDMHFTIAKKADATFHGAFEGNAISLRVEGTLKASLLDTPITAGPFAWNVQGRLIDPAGTKQRWDAAEANSPVVLNWEPVGPASITRA